MRVAVTTFGGDGGKSGISRYIIQLLRQFDRQAAASDAFDVFLYGKERDLFLRETRRLRAVPFGDHLSGPVRNILWHQLDLPGLMRRSDYDVLFLPAANRRLPLFCSVPRVGTVHDFSSLHMENKYNPARLFYIKQVLPLLVRQLTRVLTVSESSRRDIVEYAGVDPDRVDVTPLAADPSRYRPLDPEMARDRVWQVLGIEPPYLLYISRLEHPGKNHVGLIRAFDRLKARYREPLKLVLAGSDWLGAEQVHTEAARALARDDIHFTGFFADEELPWLYNGAAAFVFPSLYEGFGLPLLEAMACGVPVACSNVSSMPEVAGDAAIQFDPRDEEAMEEAMHVLLTDETTRRQCVERGLERAQSFSWARTAEATLACLERAAREAA